MYEFNKKYELFYIIKIIFWTSSYIYNSYKSQLLENEIKSFNKSTIDTAVSNNYEQEKQILCSTVSSPDTDKTVAVVSGCTETNKLSIPKHIAVIMDGNRRFGKKLYNDPLKVNTWSFISTVYFI